MSHGLFTSIAGTAFTGKDNPINSIVGHPTDGLGSPVSSPHCCGASAPGNTPSILPIVIRLIEQSIQKCVYGFLLSLARRFDRLVIGIARRLFRQRSLVATTIVQHCPQEAVHYNSVTSVPVPVPGISSLLMSHYRISYWLFGPSILDKG